MLQTYLARHEAPLIWLSNHRDIQACKVFGFLSGSIGRAIINHNHLGVTDARI
jgi:hypothetical protein